MCPLSSSCFLLCLIYSAPSSHRNFFEKSTELLTYAHIKTLQGPLNFISAPPTSFPCSPLSSHAGLFSVPTPGPLHMQFCPAVIAWPTSGKPPGYPIPNALASHLTLHLLKTCLGHKRQCSIHHGAWTIPALSHSDFLCLCFFISTMEKMLAPPQWPV